MTIVRRNTLSGLVNVAWQNHAGVRSKTHYAYGFDQALCGQWLPENFNLVPKGFGTLCAACAGHPLAQEGEPDAPPTVHKYSLVHCFHYTGSGTAHGGGGSSFVYCCHCNRRFTVRWTIEHRSIKDHGPYAEEDVKIHDWPTEPCPVLEEEYILAKEKEHEEHATGP